MSDNWDELFDDLVYSGRVGSDESRVAARAALRSAISAVEQERDKAKAALQAANEELAHYRSFVYSHPWLEYRARVGAK
jgi:hypothetical protein